MKIALGESGRSGVCYWGDSGLQFTSPESPLSAKPGNVLIRRSEEVFRRRYRAVERSEKIFDLSELGIAHAQGMQF